MMALIMNFKPLIVLYTIQITNCAYCHWLPSACGERKWFLGIIFGLIYPHVGGYYDVLVDVRFHGIYAVKLLITNLTTQFTEVKVHGLIMTLRFFKLKCGNHPAMCSNQFQESIKLFH